MRAYTLDGKDISHLRKRAELFVARHYSDSDQEALIVELTLELAMTEQGDKDSILINCWSSFSAKEEPEECTSLIS